jgi:glycerophosphoryl diester phosphodiesterase
LIGRVRLIEDGILGDPFEEGFMIRWLICLSAVLSSTALLAGEPAAVEIIGHRGASHDAPENTVAAFKEAWAQNADGAEFDIYLSRDCQIVAIHDKDTKRTTAGAAIKTVVETNFDELRSLDVGTWKNPKFAGEKIPTFDEMLAAVPEGRKVYIEVKCGPEIVPLMLHHLRLLGRDPKLTPVICFNAEVVAAVKKARPDLQAYWLSDLKEPKTAESLIAKAKEIGADGLDLKAGPELDQAFADKVRAAGLRLDVWTVNDASLARRMATIGVQGITTDRPAWLRAELGKPEPPAPVETETPAPPPTPKKSS